VRRSDNLIEGQLRLETIDNHPVALLSTSLLPRSVMQSGQQGVRYLVGWVALLISIVVAAWHAYSGRLKRTSELAANNETRYPRHLRSRRFRNRAVRSHVPSHHRRESPGASLVGASLDELRRRDVATIFDTPVSLAPGNARDDVADTRPAQVIAR
jgi:hypothetical protein